MPEARNATTSDAPGTATVSQRGCLKRRSILTWIVPSRHEQADLLDVGVRRSELTEDRTFVHHDDAVRQCEDFVEVLADQEDGDSFGRSFTDVRMHGLNRTD